MEGAQGRVGVVEQASALPTNLIHFVKKGFFLI